MIPLRTLRQIVHPTGQHRRPRHPAPARIQVPLDHLLGPSWRQAEDEPTPPYGAAVVQAWQDCPPCGKATAGVVHEDGWTCGECFGTTPGQGAS